MPRKKVIKCFLRKTKRRDRYAFLEPRKAKDFVVYHARPGFEENEIIWYVSIWSVAYQQYFSISDLYFENHERAKEYAFFMLSFINQGYSLTDILLAAEQWR